MNVRLDRILADDQRTTSQLATGEVVEHAVRLTVDSRPRVFSVYLKAHVLRGVDASMVYGDELLEELLRFEPTALSSVFAAVAASRRGEHVALPVELVDSDDGHDAAAGFRG